MSKVCHILVVLAMTLSAVVMAQFGPVADGAGSSIDPEVLALVAKIDDELQGKGTITAEDEVLIRAKFSEAQESNMMDMLLLLDGWLRNRRYRIESFGDQYHRDMADALRAVVVGYPPLARELEEITNRAMRANAALDIMYDGIDPVFEDSEFFRNMVEAYESALWFTGNEKIQPLRVELAAGRMPNAEEAGVTDKEFCMLADISDQLCQTEIARGIYLDGLKLFPNSSAMLNGVAYFLSLHGGNLDEALGYAGKALLIDIDSWYIRDTLAWILFQQGNKEAAKREMWLVIVAQFKSKNPMPSDIMDHIVTVGGME